LKFSCPQDVKSDHDITSNFGQLQSVPPFMPKSEIEQKITDQFNLNKIFADKFLEEKQKHSPHSGEQNTEFILFKIL
jgi:hypothetical protein